MVALTCGVGCGERRQTVSSGRLRDGVVMTGLRLVEERDGRIALDLSAKTARMQPHKREATLQHLEARFEVPEAGAVRVRAERGVLGKRGERLEVLGKVEAHSADGSWVRTERAVYHVSSRQLRIPGRVTAGSKRAWARGARANLDVAGRVLTLEGGVEARLWP